MKVVPSSTPRHPRSLVSISENNERRRGLSVSERARDNTPHNEGDEQAWREGSHNAVAEPSPVGPAAQRFRDDAPTKVLIEDIGRDDSINNVDSADSDTPLQQHEQGSLKLKQKSTRRAESSSGASSSCSGRSSKLRTRSLSRPRGRRLRIQNSCWATVCLPVSMVLLVVLIPLAHFVAFLILDVFVGALLLVLVILVGFCLRTCMRRGGGRRVGGKISRSATASPPPPLDSEDSPPAAASGPSESSKEHSEHVDDSAPTPPPASKQRKAQSSFGRTSRSLRPPMITNKTSAITADGNELLRSLRLREDGRRMLTGGADINVEFGPRSCTDAPFSRADVLLARMLSTAQDDHDAGTEADAEISEEEDDEKTVDERPPTCPSPEPRGKRAQNLKEEKEVTESEDHVSAIASSPVIDLAGTDARVTRRRASSKLDPDDEDGPRLHVLPVDSPQRTRTTTEEPRHDPPADGVGRASPAPTASNRGQLLLPDRGAVAGTRGRGSISSTRRGSCRGTAFYYHADGDRRITQHAVSLHATTRSASSREACRGVDDERRSTAILGAGDEDQDLCHCIQCVLHRLDTARASYLTLKTRVAVERLARGFYTGRLFAPRPPPAARLVSCTTTSARKELEELASIDAGVAADILKADVDAPLKSAVESTHTSPRTDLHPPVSSNSRVRRDDHEAQSLVPIGTTAGTESALASSSSSSVVLADEVPVYYAPRFYAGKLHVPSLVSRCDAPKSWTHDYLRRFLYTLISSLLLPAQSPDSKFLAGLRIFTDMAIPGFLFPYRSKLQKARFWLACEDRACFGEAGGQADGDDRALILPKTAYRWDRVQDGVSKVFGESVGDERTSRRSHLRPGGRPSQEIKSTYSGCAYQPPILAHYWLYPKEDGARGRTSRNAMQSRSRSRSSSSASSSSSLGDDNAVDVEQEVEKHADDHDQTFEGDRADYHFVNARERLRKDLLDPASLKKRAISRARRVLGKTDEEVRNTRVLLHFHGGAFFSVQADASMACVAAWVMWNYQRKMNQKTKPPEDADAKVQPAPRIVTLLAEYRRSPEWDVECAHQDALSLYSFLVDDLGVPTQNIAVLGDSAGGQVALQLMLRLGLLDDVEGRGQEEDSKSVSQGADQNAATEEQDHFVAISVPPPGSSRRLGSDPEPKQERERLQQEERLRDSSLRLARSKTLHPRGRHGPPGCCVLLSPWCDLSASIDSHASFGANRRTDIVHAETYNFVGSVIPKNSGRDSRDPVVSGITALRDLVHQKQGQAENRDLRQLLASRKNRCRVLIHSGEVECLRDVHIELAQLMGAKLSHRAETRLEVFHDLSHVGHIFYPSHPMGRVALQNIVNWILDTPMASD